MDIIHYRIYEEVESDDYFDDKTKYNHFIIVYNC